MSGYTRFHTLSPWNNILSCTIANHHFFVVLTHIHLSPLRTLTNALSENKGIDLNFDHELECSICIAMVKEMYIKRILQFRLVKTFEDYKIEFMQIVRYNSLPIEDTI